MSVHRGKVRYPKEFGLALVYAVLIVVCTILVQAFANDYMERFSDLLNGFLFTIATLVFTFILTAVSKRVIQAFMGDHFVLKSFVAMSCILLIVVCLLASVYLKFWWLTALFSVIGTLAAFVRKAR